MVIFQLEDDRGIAAVGQWLVPALSSKHLALAPLEYCPL